MNVESFISVAVAQRVIKCINEDGHLFCPNIPKMDVKKFLACLRDVSNITDVSLALVGYDLEGKRMTDKHMREQLEAQGVRVNSMSTSLHKVAEWRNIPRVHSKIIALTVGNNPGVNTLAHFPQADTRDLVESLLTWASTNPNSELATTARHKLLLQALYPAISDKLS